MHRVFLTWLRREGETQISPRLTMEQVDLTDRLCLSRWRRPWRLLRSILSVSERFNVAPKTVEKFSLKLSIPSLSRKKPAVLVAEGKGHRKTVVSARWERSERSGLMQACRLCAESRTVCGPRGAPVTQRGLSGLAVSQPVRDGEAGVSLQLRQNHQHLPERRKTGVTIRLSTSASARPSVGRLSVGQRTCAEGGRCRRP